MSDRAETNLGGLGARWWDHRTDQPEQRQEDPEDEHHPVALSQRHESEREQQDQVQEEAAKANTPPHEFLLGSQVRCLDPDPRSHLSHHPFRPKRGEWLGSGSGGRCEVYSALTVIRPVRWCVIAAPAQSTTAFARSSFVGSSAKCTVPQANWAAVPLSVRPPSIWTTAARRPIVAIVPLSRYLNGLATLPAMRRAIVSPACSPDWSATEPSCGRTCFSFASVIAAMSPRAYTSGWSGRVRSGPTPMRSPRSSSIPSERTSSFPRRPAPQTRVCASSTLPDFSVTRVGDTDETISPT